MSSGKRKTLIVDLAETLVRECKNKVKAAIMISLFEYLSRGRTANLASMDLYKGTDRHHLSIAVLILAASNPIPFEPIGCYALLGELPLKVSLRSVRGTLPTALCTKSQRRRLEYQKLTRLKLH